MLQTKERVQQALPSYRQVLQNNPRVEAKNLVSRFFKDDWGNRFILTDGQADIFLQIYYPQFTRVVIRTITQYGKSEIASMALVLAAIKRREKILIIAPKTQQAEIIMGNVIKHLFDDEIITNMMIHEGSLERLKSERSKNRITFRNGSEIFILTANADEINKEGKALMGFGATLIVVDESSLIPDIIFSKIFRMVGSAVAGGDQRKLVQLGNPFEANHFQRAFNSKYYTKIIIKKEQALAEGRVTQEFLDEARENITELEWQIFYECEFPVGGAQDSLIPWDWIDKAVDQDIPIGDYKQVGLDVARFGRDRSIYTLREGGKVTRQKEFEKMDTMQLVGWSSKLLDDDKVDVVGVDVIGIGSGVYDRLAELNYPVVGVNVGESCDDEEDKGRYMNKRAFYYFHLRGQFQPDEKTGKSFISIPNNAELIKQLKELRYKIASDKRIKIEEKEEMKKRLGGLSPDHADALMLAFAPIEDDKPGMAIL